MEILDIQALSFEYPDGKRALEDISFSLFRGSLRLCAAAPAAAKPRLCAC